MVVDDKPPVAAAVDVQALLATIATLAADKAALTAINIKNADTIATLVTNNTALVTTNAANSATNTDNAATITGLKNTNARVVILVQQFKKAFARERKMRHASDGRYGAATGKTVKKMQEINDQLQERLNEYKYDYDVKSGDLNYVNGYYTNDRLKLKRCKARLAKARQGKTEYKQKYNDAINEIARIKGLRKGDHARVVATKMTVLAYLRAVVNGSEPYAEFFTLATLIKKIAVFAKDAVRPETPTQLGNALIALKFTDATPGGIRRLVMKRVNCRAFDVPKLRDHLQQFAAL